MSQITVERTSENDYKVIIGAVGGKEVIKIRLDKSETKIGFKIVTVNALNKSDPDLFLMQLECMSRAINMAKWAR